MVVRVLRPDRITAALTGLIKEILPKGKEFVECDSELNSFQILEQVDYPSFLFFDFLQLAVNVIEKAYDDSSPIIPLYFILSPGADIVSDVDKLAVSNLELT